MLATTTGLSPLAELAEEFLARCRRGERPEIAEYAANHPELADRIRECFPALLAVEELKPRATDGAIAGLERLGDYRILREVGRGGMGVVYEAEQESLGRRVALKVLGFRSGTGPRSTERFLREARAAARLHHTNIVPVFGVGEHDGIPYYVMQFIEGRGLDSQARPLDWRTVASLGDQVAEALQYAHEQGIFHRDIKPSNLLWDGRGTVWITDFGLAKAADHDALTQTGDLVGTLRYMAPERFRGECDARSDLYALGLTMYELLSGRPAFAETDRAALIHQVTHAGPGRLGKLDPAIPRDLETVVHKAIERSPSDRYSTAGAMAEDLRRLLDDRPITARRPSTPERLARWSRRNPMVAGLSALVFGLLLTIAVGSTGMALQIREEAGRVLLALASEEQANDELRATQEKLRRALYATRINLGRHAWDAGGVARVREILEETRPKPGEADLRGFEWHYLRRLYHSDHLTLKGHDGAVGAVAYSKDGTKVASAGVDHTVRLWDADSGKELHVLKGHTGAVASVAFAPDGKRLASAGLDPMIRIWDVATGRESLAIASYPKGTLVVAFSPDGTRLAAAGFDSLVKVMDAATGKEVLALRGDQTGQDLCFVVAFSPDGQRLATLDARGSIRLWDAHTGKETLSLEAGHAMGHRLAFSPDGKRLAAAVAERAVRVWDVETGREELTLKGHIAPLLGVTFGPDGKRIASCGYDQTARVWDAATGAMTHSFNEHTGDVYDAAFRPDGKRLATASTDGTVKIWDVSVPQGQRVLEGHTKEVMSVAFSPDGTRLASGGYDQVVKLWDVGTGRAVETFEGRLGVVSEVAFHPDGRLLAAAANVGVKAWEVTTGKEAFTIAPPDGRMAFSPDRARMATAADRPGGEVTIRDAMTGKELSTLKGHAGGVRSVAFSPDGKRLASGGEDGSVKVWDAILGQELWTLGRPVTRTGQVNYVASVAFSPDGKRLASAGYEPKIRIWDVDSGREALTLAGHIGPVNGMAFSPDGTRLASASRDETVKVWDAGNGLELLTIKGRAAFASVAFSPDGTRLAAAGSDRAVRIWDGSPPPAGAGRGNDAR